jgi:hypothetical protein
MTLDQCEESSDDEGLLHELLAAGVQAWVGGNASPDQSEKIRKLLESREWYRDEVERVARGEV